MNHLRSGDFVFFRWKRRWWQRLAVYPKMVRRQVGFGHRCLLVGILVDFWFPTCGRRRRWRPSSESPEKSAATDLRSTRCTFLGVLEMEIQLIRLQRTMRTQKCRIFFYIFGCKRNERYWNKWRELEYFFLQGFCVLKCFLDLYSVENTHFNRTHSWKKESMSHMAFQAMPVSNCSSLWEVKVRRVFLTCVACRRLVGRRWMSCCGRYRWMKPALKCRKLPSRWTPTTGRRVSWHLRKNVTLDMNNDETETLPESNSHRTWNGWLVCWLSGFWVSNAHFQRLLFVLGSVLMNFWQSPSQCRNEILWRFRKESKSPHQWLLLVLCQMSLMKFWRYTVIRCRKIR